MGTNQLRSHSATLWWLKIDVLQCLPNGYFRHSTLLSTESKKSLIPKNQPLNTPFGYLRSTPMSLKVNLSPAQCL